ncbi:MAG TPA: hypothetical protein VIA06_12000 [Candidatus Dormibacteraeota bacterium]|jgi:hypothetical protein|nr:hypothetical protein [Candidatus Dormibacteraeota bacterium]
MEEALRAEYPLLALREIVRGQLDRDGIGHDLVLEELHAFVSRLRAAKRPEDEDVVLDVIDFVTGFCSPHMSLAPGDDHLPSPDSGGPGRS